MNLEDIFCPNEDCPARGKKNKGNIHPHSQKEQRCRCSVCEKTFALSKGTPFYRLRTDDEVVTRVITLMSYGCPPQAIVKAFGIDERTAKDWHQRGGTHCEAVHEHVVGEAKLDLEQVQADEIKAKIFGRVVWLAMAIMVRSRLWLGGEVSHKRDKRLIRRLAERIQRMALCRPLLLAVDGLPGYVKSFQAVFRSKMPRWGEKGRCKLVSWPDIAIVQVIKRRAAGAFEVERRIVQGCPRLIDRLRQMTQSVPGVINTAYIERLNATFRQRLAPLARRTRNLAQQKETLQAGMYMVGCFYNFCDNHRSLRQRLWVGEHGYKWVQFTPAMVAGLADNQWTAYELLTFKVPPPQWTPPKRRGRPSKETLQLIERWC